MDIILKFAIFISYLLTDFYAAEVLSVLVLSLSWEWTIMGCVWPFTVLPSIITSSTLSWLGKSYIVFNNILSSIDLKPLAPVFLLIAFIAISLTALSLKVSFAPSNLNSSWYCFTREFFGSWSIFIKDFSSRSSKVAIIGSRPINSGIKPYFN